MKKILIAAAIIAAPYYLYSQSGSNVGVYADNGTPRTIFFATAMPGWLLSIKVKSIVS